MTRRLTRTAAAAAFLAGGSALADDFEFSAQLSGAQEVVVMDESVVPGGVDTAATGTAAARFDPAFTTVSVQLQVQGLTGAFMAAHFHCARAGENGPVVFGLVSPGPLAFDGESIAGDLTNADYTGEDCMPIIGRPVNNVASLALAMRDGLIYANVHTDLYPAGEIRGQMVDDGAFTADPDDPFAGLLDELAE